MSCRPTDCMIPAILKDENHVNIGRIIMIVHDGNKNDRFGNVRLSGRQMICEPCFHLLSKFLFLEFANGCNRLATASELFAPKNKRGTTDLPEQIPDKR